MTTKSIPVLLMLALLTVACSTPRIAVDNNLQASTTIYPVKGRQGWQINQRLSIGDYQTGKVERGWKKAYDIPFIVRFSGAKERLGFDLNHAGSSQAEVFALGKLNEQDLPLFNNLFEINLNARDVFSGTVVLRGSEHYDFYVANLNQNNWFREASGAIRTRNAQLDIRPVQKLSNGQTMLSEQVPGFEYVLDGQVVGAVETLNDGQVWLRDDLRSDLKTVLVGVSAALLLRSELLQI